MPKIGHTYSEKPTSKDNTHHTGLCKICNQPFEEEHHDTDSDGFCDECEAELGTNYGSLEAPISVVQALKIAADECKNSNDATAQKVIAKGVVVSIGSTGSYYKEVVIRDESDVNKSILIRSLNMADNVDNPDVNDTITIEGYIKKYDDGSIGFSTNNGVFVNMRANTRGQSKITLGEHGDANVSGFNATEPNGSEVSLVITVPDGKKVTEVKVNGTKINAESDGKTYKFVVHGDAEITVTTADEGAEPEPEDKVIAFTFPSINNTNETTALTNYSETVDGYTLKIASGTKVFEGKDHTLKLGASKDTALLKFDVPEDVKSVNIYVAQYNDNNVTVTVNGIAKTLSSGQGVYECISVDTTETHSITLTTSGIDYRARINKIEWVVSGSSGGGGDVEPGGGGDQGSEQTVTITFSDLASKQSWTSTSTNLDGKNVTVGDITFAFSDGTNTNNKIAYYKNGSNIRIYSGNTLTVSVAQGHTITEIAFTTSQGTLTCEVGKISGNTWTGDSNSVKFGASSSTRTTVCTITYK